MWAIKQFVIRYTGDEAVLAGSLTSVLTSIPIKGTWVWRACCSILDDFVSIILTQGRCHASARRDQLAGAVHRTPNNKSIIKPSIHRQILIYSRLLATSAFGVAKTGIISVDRRLRLDIAATTRLLPSTRILTWKRTSPNQWNHYR